MKSVKLYSRKVMEKTGFRKYPYKEVEQVSIFYDGKEFCNHNEDVANPRLRKKFVFVWQTRSTQILIKYISQLGSTDCEKWQKDVLSSILREVKK